MMPNIFTQRNFVADFIQYKLNYSQKQKISFLGHPLGDLGVTHALHPWLVGKPVVDFLFVIIELFSLALMVETILAEICQSRRFTKELGHCKRKFPVEGDIAHQPLSVSEN